MRTALDTALEGLSPAVQNALQKILSSPSFDATISPEDVQHLLKISNLDDAALLLALLPLSASFALTPISNFNVGAIARAQTGRLYFGANMEFLGVQLNQSVHAEQSAISHAWLKGETGITDITINYSPCGHCRQFMNELNGAQNLIIRLPDKQEKTLHQYLPEAFGPNDLGITKGLLCPTNHALTLKASLMEDPLINAALNAANRSHAPYSKNTSGLAIKDINGQIFSGMSAENAAFNPSLPPLQVALNAMNLACASLEKISEVVFIEKENAPISHLQETRQILHVLNPNITFTSFLI